MNAKTLVRWTSAVRAMTCVSARASKPHARALAPSLVDSSGKLREVEAHLDGGLAAPGARAGDDHELDAVVAAARVEQAGGDAAAGVHGRERALVGGVQPVLNLAVLDGMVEDGVVALEPEVVRCTP